MSLQLFDVSFQRVRFGSNGYVGQNFLGIAYAAGAHEGGPSMI